MADDPGPDAGDSSSVWSFLRAMLHGKERGTLRASIEEAMRDHPAAESTPDDLDGDERLMLRNMLRLSERKAADVAVPRADIIAIADHADFSQLVDSFREAEHSRLPVYHLALDEVVGMLHVKDVYAVVADRFSGKVAKDLPLPPLSQLIRPVLFVPPSMPLVDLLTEMRRKRTHMAILVDEYGGTDGLISIEDIVEEIVGEIEDEHDEEEPALLSRRPDGTIEADARIELDDLERQLGVDFSYAEFRHEVGTLGGLAVLLLEHVPEAGEEFVHRNGWTIRVEESDDRRISRLLLRPPAVPSAAVDE